MARKVLIYVVLVVIVVNAVIIALVFSGGAGPAPRPMPNPNGYDDFVKAGQMVGVGHGYVIGGADNYDGFLKWSKGAGARAFPFGPSDATVLHSAVNANAQALKLVQSGLNKACRMPVRYSTKHFDDQIAQQMKFEHLIWLMLAGGKLAEMEGRTNEAAKIYLDEMRFAQEISRGGFMADAYFSMAKEDRGLSAIRMISDQLDAQTCYAIAQNLIIQDEIREPTPDIIARDKVLFHRTSELSLKERILMAIRTRSTDPNKAEYVLFSNDVKQKQREERKLAIDLALRAFELEKGKPPQSAADLVPEYLKAIPKDPVTGKEMGLGR